MKLKLLSDNLILELKELEKDSLDIISISNKAIILCRNLLTSSLLQSLQSYISWKKGGTEVVHF